ncbi:MAG: hypothetical protein BAA01_06355 [Bacillus thermozeamaize]|uniref:Transglutaminase-like domain-containing protein n=1 Tax=Bacillus thermozeamaize TaxID=230954 RepID=A0A1Y3PEH7_9BACI|nr:MAG: hypothetical protein BAA01_06355 [Bacillus thermozeamaize]
MSVRRGVHLLIVALFLFFMGWEWLKPFQVLSDTADLRIFLSFLAVFCLSRLFRKPRWLPFALTWTGFVCLFYVHYYRDTGWFSLSWLGAWGREIKASLPFLLARDWLAMSPLSRTFFFLIALWFACFVIWHYVYVKRRVLWFVFLSVVYFSVLDTFTPYEGRFSIMMTLVSGLFLMAWLRLPLSDGRLPLRMGVQWLAGSLALLMLATAVAYAAPKPAPAWPDPVPWLLHRGQPEGIPGSAKKVGYGTNDAHLGGPFVQDDTVVLEVQTTERAYLRGESKDFYTGKGWISMTAERDKDSPLTVAVGEEVPPDFPHLFDDTAIAVRQVEQQIAWAAGAPLLGGGANKRYPIFHQGMVQVVEEAAFQKRVFSGDAGAQTLIWGDEASGIFTEENPVTKAVVRSVLPVIDEEKMRLTGQAYPEEIRRRYLQLPESLPPRVRQLAALITRDADNPYDKAKAVEQYLRSPEFVYDTQEVSIPEADQDFVDHFLFESKRGYCDYFSTSMVVMLRSVGIPARWVKGFTAGELVKKTVPPADGEAGAKEQSYYEGKVYSRNAHSWVEVYFEGVGWLPFEPTKGFVMPQMTQQEAVSAVSPGDEPPEQAEQKPEEESGEQAVSGPPIGWQEWMPLSDGPDVRIALVTLALLILMGLAWWRYRIHLWFWWQARRMRSRDVSPETYLRAYRRLLASFARRHRREPRETIREYLQRIRVGDELEEDLARQTVLYEQLRYGGRASDTLEQGGLNQMFHALYRSFLAMHSRK